MANSVMANTRLYRSDFQSCEPFFICLTTPYEGLDGGESGIHYSLKI